MDKYRRHIGYCPDRLPVDGKLTGFEFMDFFRRLYHKDEEEVENILSLIDIGEAVDRPVKTYSKGMQKRLSVGRILLIDPLLYLLDEPTSGLDPSGQRLIQNIILTMEKKGRVVILSSHNMYEVERVCDEIYFIKDGKFSTLDSVTEAFKDEMFIIDITVKEVTDELVHSLLREYELLTFLSSSKSRIRLSAKGKIDKSNLLHFIQSQDCDVIEIKYM